jgi:segregation and condensation protein A
MQMTEKPIPWWRKALKYALGGIRSGFGLFPKAAKPAPIEPFPPEEERFLESSKPTLEVEQALTNRPANAEAVPAASETVIETIVVTEPEPVANPAPVRLPAPVPASAVDPTGVAPIDMNAQIEPMDSIDPIDAEDPTQQQEPEPAPVVQSATAAEPAPAAESLAVDDPASASAPDLAPQIQQVESVLEPAVSEPAVSEPAVENPPALSAEEPVLEAATSTEFAAESSPTAEPIPAEYSDRADVIAKPTPEFADAIESAQATESENLTEPTPEADAVPEPMDQSVSEVIVQLSSIPEQPAEPVTELAPEAEPVHDPVVLSDSIPEQPARLLTESAPAPAPEPELEAELPPEAVDPPVAEPAVAIAQVPEPAPTPSVEPPAGLAPEPVPAPVPPPAPEAAAKLGESLNPAAQPGPDQISDEKAAAKLMARQKRLDEASEDSPFSVFVGQVYDGPLDLLLDLIRKQDIDIYDIPIAKITAQFLAYVNQLKATDVDVAGEFIYTASLLIHIKSKMLLPRSPAGPDDAAEDPRRELVDRLLEHERFKNAAQMLQQKQMLEAATWSNPGFREFQDDAGAEPEIAADTVDLVRIFRDILERARSRPVLDVEEDAVTVGQMIQFLARRLTMEDKPVALRRLLSHTRSERALVAMFLALLELVRLQAVLLRQDRAFSDIFIKKHTGFDAVMNQGLTNALDDWR